MKTAKHITSQSNPTYKLFKTILESRGIRKHGKAILAGRRIINEAVTNHPGKCLATITKKGCVFPNISSANLPDEFPHYVLDKQLFNEIDVWNATDYFLLVKVEEFPSWNPANAPDGCTLLIPFQDPSNVGAVIRSAAGFGVSSIVLLDESAHPFHPKSVRAASGYLFSIPLFKGPSINNLDTGNLPLLLLDPDGEDISSFKPPERYGLLCGMEGPGMPANIATSSEIRRLRIPIADAVESLNATVATSIALYALDPYTHN